MSQPLRRANRLMVRFVTCTICLGWAAAGVLRAADDVDFFERKIRPILAEHCYACHSAEAEQKGTLKGGLRLDTRATIRLGGSSGPAVVPSNVGESLILSALRHDSFEMPPSGKLPDSVVADFARWIAKGATDPRDGDESVARHGEAAPANPLEHWSYQQRRDPPHPEVADREWPRDDLDRFVLARLEAAGQTPAGQADRRTWIRRVSYDLIGLPPTVEQVARFVNDDDPEAFATVADALLDSPHFGVHWARVWLDNVRYTQDDYTCCAFATNEFDSTPYRDWLVRAFNDDLPYDTFVKFQIAGDLIPHADPDRVNADGITATGLWTFPHIIADNDPDKVIVDFVDQQLDVLGRTFIGLTLACARCHDHKFDPISQRDYYGLAGIFLSSHSLTHANPDTGDATRLRAAYRVEVPVLRTRTERNEYERREADVVRLPGRADSAQAPALQRARPPRGTKSHQTTVGTGPRRRAGTPGPGLRGRSAEKTREVAPGKAGSAVPGPTGGRRVRRA